MGALSLWNQWNWFFGLLNSSNGSPLAQGALGQNTLRLSLKWQMKPSCERPANICVKPTDPTICIGWVCGISNLTPNMDLQSDFKWQKIKPPDEPPNVLLGVSNHVFYLISEHTPEHRLIVTIFSKTWCSYWFSARNVLKTLKVLDVLSHAWVTTSSKAYVF